MHKNNSLKINNNKTNNYKKEEELKMKKTYNVNDIKNLITEAIELSVKYNPENDEIHFLIGDDLTVKDFSISENPFSAEEGTVITVVPYSEGDVLNTFADSFIEYFDEISDLDINYLSWYKLTNIRSDYSKKFNKKLAELFKFLELNAVKYHSSENGICFIFNKKKFEVVDIVTTKNIYKIIDEDYVSIYINSSKYDYIIDIAKECKEAIESTLNITFTCDFQYEIEIFAELFESSYATSSKENALMDYFKNALSETELHNIISSVIDITKKHKLFAKEVYFRISNELEVVSASLNADEVAGNNGIIIAIDTDANRYWEDIADKIVQGINDTFGRNFRYSHWYEVNNKTYTNKKFDSPDYYRYKIIDFKELPEDAKAIYFID